MEQSQHTYPKKCKLKLTQPVIKCGGRDDVECYYRGLIKHEDDYTYYILFKYKGQLIFEPYDKSIDAFLDIKLKDIKLVR